MKTFIFVNTKTGEEKPLKADNLKAAKLLLNELTQKKYFDWKLKGSQG